MLLVCERVRSVRRVDSPATTSSSDAGFVACCSMVALSAVLTSRQCSRPQRKRIGKSLGFARHAVLVTHVEPAPTHDSSRSEPCSAGSRQDRRQCAWRRFWPRRSRHRPPFGPLVLGRLCRGAGRRQIALSLIAPRAMPRPPFGPLPPPRRRLRRCRVCAAATRQPHPMRFPEPEATELLVVSPLLDLNSTDAAMGARVSPNGSARSPVGGHAERAGRGAPQGGGGGVSSHELQAADVVSKPVGAKRDGARGGLLQGAETNPGF